MPDKSTIEKAKKDKAEGKSAGTQAGEFVHDEIKKVREGKHGVRSAKQAIAIGLSEARRAGVKLPPPKNADAALKKQAEAENEKGEKKEPVSKSRSRASIKALKKEPSNTVSKAALSKQGRSAAKKRTASERTASARKAARTRAKNKK